MEFLKQNEFLEKISNWGFKTNPLTRVVKDINEIESRHNYIDILRSGLDYDIDGLVFKVNDLNLQTRLGSTSILQDGQQHINFQQSKLLLK